MTANTTGDALPTTSPTPSSTSPTIPAEPVPYRIRARDRVRDLHPGWFALVMGTAILSVAADENPGDLAAFSGPAHALGVGLAVLAYGIGVVLAIAYAVRWVRYPRSAVSDLRHPVLGAMHATLPGGILVLAIMTSAVGPAMLSPRAVVALIAVLAVLGSTIALILSVAFTYLLFTGESSAVSVNGGWFIPPVVTVIIPIAVAPLISHASDGAARLLLFAGYAAYGMGFLLFLIVIGLLYNRLVLHPLPPAALAPTLWIGLGPVGVSTLAPLALARAGQHMFGDVGPTITTLSQVVGTAVWGFGLWWLALAVALLVRYLRAGALPFHIGWWAFTFPLGAFTVATVSLARAWQLPAVDALAGILFLALVAFWGVVAARTIAAARTGRIWLR